MYDHFIIRILVVYLCFWTYKYVLEILVGNLKEKKSNKRKKERINT